MVFTKKKKIYNKVLVNIYVVTGISAGPPMTANTPRRVGYFSALPRVNLPNVHVPQMMDISSYIPTIRPPPFLKDVYTFPNQVGDHVNREVRNIGSNINKVC